MNRIPDFKDTEEEKQYWDSHSVADHLDELEPVEVDAKPTLTHTLSVRMTSEDLRKLRELGKESGIGTTTMARFILRQALKNPNAIQFGWLSLGNEGVQSEVQAMWEEGKIPQDGEAPVMYFFSSERIRHLAQLMMQSTAKEMFNFLKEIGSLQPDNEGYTRLLAKEKELQAAARS